MRSEMRLNVELMRDTTDNRLVLACWFGEASRAFYIKLI